MRGLCCADYTGGENGVVDSCENLEAVGEERFDGFGGRNVGYLRQDLDAWVCGYYGPGGGLEAGFGEVREDDLCAAFAGEGDGCCCADACGWLDVVYDEWC